MKEVNQVLRENKIRVTPQRLGVYKILKQEARHFYVEEIYDKIRKKFPAVSLATVYSILELLKDKKLVQEIRINFNRSCFEARLDLHHHFLCQECGKIFDIDIAPCPTLEKKKVDGHIINSLQGYFYGICRNCNKET